MKSGQRRQGDSHHCPPEFREQYVPIRPQRRSRPFDDREYVYELKWDGWRGLFRGDLPTPRFESRAGAHLLRFDRLAGVIHQELSRRPVVLDGELVCLDDQGRPCFDDLMRGRRIVTYCVFDLLMLNGEDYRPLPLLERKRRLKRLLARCSVVVRYVDHIKGWGEALYQEAVHRDLEGIVAKKSTDPYDVKTVRWWKIKTPHYSQAIGRELWFQKQEKNGA